MSPTAEVQSQADASTLKYQLENAKNNKRQLKAQYKKLEEELSQLKLKYEKERTKPKTDSDVDSAQFALLESSIEQCKDKIIVSKMRIKDQQEVINRVQQQIEQIALKNLQFASEEHYETKEMVDQNFNTSDTEIKKIRVVKKEKAAKEQPIEKPEPARQSKLDGNMNQQFTRLSQEDQSFPAVGVRCLFCDRPANRISNDVTVAKPRKSDMHHKLRRPQTAREKMDRPTIHYGTKRRKNHAVNIKIMDGVVAPPSPTRHSFRVSALVANPSKQHTNQPRKRQTSNMEKK